MTRDDGESVLQRVARQAMEERGMAIDLPDDAQAQLDDISGKLLWDGVKDLRKLLWCSIDNDDSLDLDQITVYQTRDSGTRLLVGVADVDSVVPKDSPLDRHAWQNTVTVYTPPRIYWMLPDKLTCNLTSLNYNVDRLALIIQIDMAYDGSIVGSDVYRAVVRNQAKLHYNAVAQWLEERLPPPHEVAAVDGMEDQLRRQDKVAQALREQRIEHGALEFDTLEARSVLQHGQVVDLKLNQRNRAKQLIEDCMIAANGVIARYLRDHGWPSLRRVVKTPKRWDRMVAIAAERHFELPAQPDSKALNEFLKQEKTKDPLRFPDLSLTMIKLMGPGEYAVEQPGETPTGHFGLAVKDYSHSTAPNRRYPDLITHRMLKALLAGHASPYSPEALEALAEHCTAKENDAQKVERRVQKSANALLLANSVGSYFDALVTGVNPDGTWVRLLHPPIEGKLVGERPGKRQDVGDRVRVKLVHVDVLRGFIDFVMVGIEH